MKDKAFWIASYIQSLWTDRNPIAFIWEETGRRLKTIFFLKGNMKASQDRIVKLEAQNERLEALIRESRTNPWGSKIDKLR